MFKGLNLELWQEIVLIVLFALIVLFIIYILVLLLTEFGRKNSTKEEVIIKEITIKKKQLEQVKAQELKTPVLSEKEIRVRKKIEESNITRKELIILEKQEGIVIPEDFIINSITANELKANKFANIKNGNKSIDIKELKKHLNSKNRVECNLGVGKRADVYKINGRTICMFKELDNGKFLINLKLGPAYATSMKEIFKNSVIDSVFPQGLVWFTYTNENSSDLTLEVVKQAIDISYAIASLGY